MSTSIEQLSPNVPPDQALQRLPNAAIASVYIENFRCFGVGRWIELSDEHGITPQRVVLHGKSGSGKSTFLTALGMFWDLATDLLLVLQDRDARMSDGERVLIGQNAADETEGKAFHGSWGSYGRRDRPFNPAGETKIAVTFADTSLGSLELTIVPRGINTKVQLFALPKKHRPVDEFREGWLRRLTWDGAHGRPRFLILDALRRATHGAYSTSIISDDLLNKLHEQSTSLDSTERRRWQKFNKVLREFTLFESRSVQIELRKNGHVPQLVFEDDVSVLESRELSTGEQNIIALLAHFVVYPHRVRAIQEPEQGLDLETQHSLSRAFDAWLAETEGSQLFIESHSLAFDSASVFRFERRGAHDVNVTRASSTAASEELRTEAKSMGARPAWVTPEGYTRLPKAMVEDLALKNGGGLWFLKLKERWESWPEEELQNAIGGEPER